MKGNIQFFEVEDLRHCHAKKEKKACWVTMEIFAGWANAQPSLGMTNVFVYNLMIRYAKISYVFL